MNTVIETTLARLPPARLSTASTCENTCFTCASKLLAMSAPALSGVAVCPATQTILPPSVTTPGEKARESWNGVFSMYSAAAAASGAHAMHIKAKASTRFIFSPRLVTLQIIGAAYANIFRRLAQLGKSSPVVQVPHQERKPDESPALA